jgi:hypothetical protein
MSNFKSFIYFFNLISFYKRYFFLIFILVNGITIAYYYKIEKINFTRIVLTANPGSSLQVYDIFLDFENLFRNPDNFKKWKKDNLTIINEVDIIGFELTSDKQVKLKQIYTFENLPTLNRSIGIYFDAANQNFIYETFLYVKFTVKNLNDIYKSRDEAELKLKFLNFTNKNNLDDISMTNYAEIKKDIDNFNLIKHYISAKAPSGLYQQYNSLKKLLVYSFLSSILFSAILLIFLEKNKKNSLSRK